MVLYFGKNHYILNVLQIFHPAKYLINNYEYNRTKAYKIPAA